MGLVSVGVEPAVEIDGMIYWVREIAGWLLVLLGLAVFLYCLSFLENGKIIEGGILTSVGVVVFRGGIHLVKVSTAARIVASDRAPTKPR